MKTVTVTERRLYLELCLCHADVYAPVVQEVTQLSQGQVGLVKKTAFSNTDSSPTLFWGAPPDDPVANAAVLPLFHNVVAPRARHINRQEAVPTQPPATVFLRKCGSMKLTQRQHAGRHFRRLLLTSLLFNFPRRM